MNNRYITYYDIGGSVSKNVEAVIGLIGVICNILSICVFQRKGLNKYSYSIYWRAIAFFDIMILLNLFRHWMRHFLNFDIDLISPLFCRLNEYQPYVAGGVCLWLESIITLDRYFSIVYPTRFKMIKQRWFQIAVIALTVTYSILASINLPFNYRLDRVNDTWTCHAPLDVLKFNWTVALINILIVNLLVNPFLDYKIICHIVSTRANVRRLSSTLFIDRKFAISAIGLNITSLILKLPFLINNLVSNFWDEQAQFIYSICLCIILIEKIDMFLVNMIVNSVFRREFFDMIGVNKNSSLASNDFINLNMNTSRSGPGENGDLL